MKHLIFALAVLVLWEGNGVARAHTVTLTNGQPFTYDAWCCNNMDCEALPPDAVTQLSDGRWRVDYVSKINGRHVAGEYSETHWFTRIKQSPDGQAHACQSGVPNGNDGAFHPRCIYPPIPFT